MSDKGETPQTGNQPAAVRKAEQEREAIIRRQPSDTDWGEYEPGDKVPLKDRPKRS